MSPVVWDDEVDGVLAGDLTAALGYRTPAGGVVVQAVAPIGMRDRDAGTIGFTTSLGFSKKLERIARDPRVAMAFHAREHGTCHSDLYVLVQGTARVIEQPTAQQRQRVRELSTLQLGPPAEGPFWNRWLREYYRARVPVEITVERIATWPDLRCAGERRVIGEPWPEAEPASQSPPKNGTGPRIDATRARRRLIKTAHHLAGFAGADGRPVVVPVTIGAMHDGRLELTGRALPPGARRAGLLGHRYQPRLIGLETRQYTGWLDTTLYAPHTETGYRAPANKTLLLLLNGLLAKRGVRAAARSSRE
ncbi:pyridoxamine 5'-phosphate oxidase family protein [Solirubrobacter soli]|uniref:pyridoxamine 5'-phosphate oxidase family protein n=1 Tax=Solirubrobacter soli TaxID=363832 RepID=UPI000426549E|nr:pyridoxamine 5'-phosphate oxidase family protein [Solirubrobacter soli]